ncbi:integral membrane sensor signal transduction histidine kinase [Geitlerinema sp. PCC 7407]|nr:integral membrane sensor signal transduction histidine kinase [Geitlerinema sp. PCC 7407]
MKPLDRGILSHNESPLKEGLRRFKQTKLSLLKLLAQRSIRQKISHSYALVIGVAILGTSTGLWVGDVLQGQARQQLLLANQQKDLLKNLELTVLEVRSHPQRLITVLGDSIWFNYEREKFLSDAAQIRAIAADLQAFAQDHPEHLAMNVDTLQDLMEQYTVAADSYRQLMETLWQDIDPGNVATSDIAAAQQEVLSKGAQGTATRHSVEFERLAERLEQGIRAAQSQESDAVVRLDWAESLRLHLILVGMVLSGAIAARLAAVLGQAIAQPIEAVTDVAQRVTRDSNFELRAPVTSRDEIGSLAQSLNHLIERTGDDTRRLEQARETLEQRVEERTQALSATLHHLQQTQAQLIQSEKMSSLGQLVAGVAHEINNPINFIFGNLEHANTYTRSLLQLLERYQTHYPDPPQDLIAEIEEMDLEFLQTDLPKLLASMRVGADRIREIVQSLRTFSRLDEAEVKAVDLHEGIDSTLMILHNRLKPKGDRPEIRVVKDYGALPRVECYSGQLNQVVMNILSNAIDALDSQRTWTAARSGYGAIALQSAPPTLKITTTQLDPRWVRLAIADNGPGMAPSVLERIFDPFFTTKEVGKGTGLGLSISHQIVVERHGGRLHCHSVLGSGTEFVIEIPVQQQGGRSR